MPSIYLFYVFMSALFVALILIPPIQQLSVRFGQLDLPDERKIHSGRISRLAGIAIFAAVMFAVILFCEFDRPVRGFLAGGLIVFATGLYDDLIGLRARWKLAGEVLAAFVAIMVGDISLHTLGDIFGFGNIDLGIFSIPFTVLGIVGVTNALNLLDGLDGLSGGIAAIAATALGFLAFVSGNSQLLLLATALVGAVLGFLKFNTYPAKIFMGDCGSLFLGFSLALLSVMLCSAPGSRISAPTPLVILAVPIVDSLIVMVKRARLGRPLFLPDNNHIHHRLLDIGIGHEGSVVIIYILGYLAAIFGVISNSLPDSLRLFSVVLIYFLLSSLHLLIRPEYLSGIAGALGNVLLRSSPAFSIMLHAAGRIVSVLKYLIIAVISLPLFLNADTLGFVPVIAGSMLLLNILLFFLTNDVSNRFLHSVIYLEGAFLVFIIENYGRRPMADMISLHQLSHIIFIVIFICCGLKIFLDRKLRELMDSPLDFLLFFTVISIPILPASFTGPFHLLTVAAKSVILFAAFRLVLMEKARRNRRVLFATMLSLLLLCVKGIV